MTEKKVTNIIEYQEDRQRTPRETLEFLLEQADKIERLVISYVTEDGAFYVPGSTDRDYRMAYILWDLQKLIHYLMTEYE